MKEETSVKAEQMKSSTNSAKVDIEDSSQGEVDDHEVFKDSAGGVKFRTVGWPMASIIFLKRTPSTESSCKAYMLI